MTDPLITAANNISKASPAIRSFAQMSAARTTALEQKVAALTPTPPTTSGTGIGLLRYGGGLAQTSHLTDGTYELVVASWSDRATLATCSGLSFAYQALPGSGAYNPLDLGNPIGAAQLVNSGLAQYPGVEGVFLDNVNGSNAAQVLSFIKTFSSAVRSQGHLLMMNANGYGYLQGHNDDGQGDAAWFAQVGPYATHLMSESWQQARDGSDVLRLRGTDNYRKFWDQWQQLPAAAHAAGCAFVGITVGRAGTVDSDQVYGRASLLTAPGFKPGDVFFGGGAASSNYTADPYDSVWTAESVSPAVDPVAGTAQL